MQVLAHNMLSQFTNRQLNISDRSREKSAEKLSSGYRINRAADDAAGLAMSETMRRQIRGLKRGQKNIEDGVSFIQVADGCMEEISKMIQRIRELSVQAANDTNSVSDRQAIDAEIKQLKSEINNTCWRAKFNEEPVFDNVKKLLGMDVAGTPDDLQVFNSSYNSATNDVMYGGFIFHGERYTWDQVAPGMVSIDSTGKQVFSGGGGDYSFTDRDGRHFTVSCREGDEVPRITRTLDICASREGIMADGTLIGWDEVVDSEGISFSDDTAHSGLWSLNYKGATVQFCVGDIADTEDMIECVNSNGSLAVSYTWNTEFTGTREVKAVDVNDDNGVMKHLRVHSGLADNVAANGAGGVSFTVRAGEDGIWLENSDGDTVNDSLRTWEQMRISSWDSGKDISSWRTYTYADDEGGANDTYISFDFQLSDVTSVDSVIDGLDGMELKGSNITTSYSTMASCDKTDGIKKFSYRASNPISFDEEILLGRDFEKWQIDHVADGRFKYAVDPRQIRLVFPSSGSTVLSYTHSGPSDGLPAGLKAYIGTRLTEIAKTLKISGKSVDDRPKDLESLLGRDHITTSGRFSENLRITGDLSSSGWSGYCPPGEVGKTYRAASIDFSELGSRYTLEDMDGMGFKFRCRNSSTPYSVMFTSEDLGSSGSVGGVKYFVETLSDGVSVEYRLKINIDSLAANGVVTGNDLAAAVVNVARRCFSSLTTKFAADTNINNTDAKLYVYDNRTYTSEFTTAFGTVPGTADDEGLFHIRFSRFSGTNECYIRVGYRYNFSNVAKDSVRVDMVLDPDGADEKYVKNPDFVDAATTPDKDEYMKYSDWLEMRDGNGEFINQVKIVDANGDPILDSNGNEQYQPNPVDKYRADVTYFDADGNAATLDDAVKSYKNLVMWDVLKHTNVWLKAEDYTYLEMKGNEKPNVAIQAVFETNFEKTPEDNDIHIQCSSEVGDWISIPRIGLNTYYLGLSRAGAKTYDEALATMDYCDHALSVLSSKRSLYGAYQNRLEHTYQVKAQEEENTQAAESRIRDTDMAKEMVEYSKGNILIQAEQAVLAQVNQLSSGILQLLD